MIIAIGYHSTVEFYQQLQKRGLPEPDKGVAVLSSLSDLSKARAVNHVIIFDTPYNLIKLENAYRFDFTLVRKKPLRFERKAPLWGVFKTLRVQPKLSLKINSELSVTQQIIDSQRTNDVIDKINRLKEFLPSDRMDKIIVAYAKFLKGDGLDVLTDNLTNIVSRSKQRDECISVIDSIVEWSSTPAAIRLITAMREVGHNWRDTYEKISHDKGIRPFELSFFLVAYERSSND